MLPNRIHSTSHSDPSSHQTLQGICLSPTFLVKQRLFYLRACGAQLAQLAGRRMQGAGSAEAVVAAVPGTDPSTEAKCPRPALPGAQPEQGAHHWQMHQRWEGKARQSPLSLWVWDAPAAQLSHCWTLICIEAESGLWSCHWVLTVDFTLPIAVISQLRQYWQFNTDSSSVHVWGGFILLAPGNLLSAREGEQRNASPSWPLCFYKGHFRKTSDLTCLEISARDHTGVCISSAENLCSLIFFCPHSQIESWRAAIISVGCLSAETDNKT